MEAIKYRMSATKSLMYMIVAVSAITLTIVIGINMIISVAIWALSVGAFGMGVVALFKRKPQIILDRQGIYVGFNEKVVLPWDKVINVVVKKESLDFGLRKVWMLKVKAKTIKKGKPVYRVIAANIEMLGINGLELQRQIDFYRGHSDSQGEELV